VPQTTLNVNNLTEKYINIANFLRPKA